MNNTSEKWVRGLALSICEAMKEHPEVVSVRADNDAESPHIMLKSIADVRRWADEAGVPLSVGDRWDEVYAVIDGVTVLAFGEW